MSVTIDKKLVLHVANLAKLTVADDEIEMYQSKLQAVVDYMDELSECDISDVSMDDGITDGISASDESAAHLVSTPERNDEIANNNDKLDIEKFLEMAPAATGTSFQVPKIIE